MLDFLKKRILKSHKDNTITAATDVMKDGITLHGEDPGTIPPDDNPNPLIDEMK